MSGIGGAGNRVATVGVEALAPSGFDGALTDKWSWSLDWAGSLSHWRARNHSASNSSLWEVGVTPVVTLRRAASSSMSSYLEAGFGVHVLSHTCIGHDIRRDSLCIPVGVIGGNLDKLAAWISAACHSKRPSCRT